jgi:hypothetical protein
MNIFRYTSKYQYIDFSKIEFLNNYNFIFLFYKLLIEYFNIKYLIFNI